MKINFIKIIFTVFIITLIASCGGDSDSSTDSDSSSDLPDVVKSNKVVFKFDNITPGASAPVNLNDEVAFTFSSSGMLSINTDNTGADEIQIDGFTKDGSEYVWTDEAGGFMYSLSLTSDGKINEINIMDSNNAFIGQFGTVISINGDTPTAFYASLNLSGDAAVTADCSSTTAGNWCLKIKTVNQTSISTPIEVVINNFTEANVPLTDAAVTAAETEAKKQFEESVASTGEVTVNSFVYTVDSTTDTKVVAMAKSSISVSTSGFSTDVDYDVIYTYEKK